MSTCTLETGFTYMFLYSAGAWASIMKMSNWFNLVEIRHCVVLLEYMYVCLFSTLL
jgi:hypothetical protein